MRCVLVVEASDADPLFVVVLLEVIVEWLGQTQAVDAVVGGGGTDGGATQVLQREGEGAGQRVGQHGLKEHATRWVFVVLYQATHSL